MGNTDLAPGENNHSDRVKDGIARARALGKKWGRPTIAERRGDPGLSKKVSRMRSQGKPWTRISAELNISTSTAKRLAGAFQNNSFNQDNIKINNSISKEHLIDTGQKDNDKDDIRCRDTNKYPLRTNLKTSEFTEAAKELRGEFIRVAIQLVIENEHLTMQVLKRIKA